MLTTAWKRVNVADAVASLLAAVKSGTIKEPVKVGATLSVAVVDADACVSVVEVVDSVCESSSRSEGIWSSGPLDGVEARLLGGCVPVGK